MDDIDRKALYWCLKLSRIAVYNQHYMRTDEAKPLVDSPTRELQAVCLDRANTVMLALGIEIGIDD